MSEKSEKTFVLVKTQCCSLSYWKFKVRKQAALQKSGFTREQALCLWMQGHGGDPALVRGKFIKAGLVFHSFSCHGINQWKGSSTDRRKCLMFCDLNAGLIEIKENGVQIGHRANNQP